MREGTVEILLDEGGGLEGGSLDGVFEVMLEDVAGSLPVAFTDRLEPFVG